MKIAILTAYTDTNKWTTSGDCDYMQVSSKNHIDYCYNHNYTYICEIFTESDYIGFHPTWIKIMALQKHIHNYDYVVWVDSDVIFTNMNTSIEDFISENLSLIIPKCEMDYTTNTVWTGITTGFMICKNDKFIHNLLQKLIDTSGVYTYDYFHEQSVLDDYLRDNDFFNEIPSLYYKQKDDLDKITHSNNISFLPYKYHKYIVDDDTYTFTYHAGGSSDTKRSRLAEVIDNTPNTIKFGIYTSFYNCESFVDNAFTQIESLNYDNFEWHITDDFSTDSTYSMIMKRLGESPIKDKIKYYTQSVKKEMYWSPNLFFDKSFEWIVLMDVDDELDTNALRVYNKVLSDVDDNVVLVSSDFHKINYDTKNLHSISYILNEEIISSKINKYHPKCDYLNNISYSCFGHLRAFKNLPHIEFQIEDRMAGAEDSYHIFWVNSYGKYLHIPRALYKWNMHNSSESHSTNILPNFNGNFDIALNKLKNSDYGVDTYYNDVYVETSALQSYDFGKLNGNSISLWTRKLTQTQIKKLTNLYFDCNLKYNNIDANIHIICLNYFTEAQLKSILSTLNSSTVLLYYQSNIVYESNEDKDLDIDNKLNNYLNTVYDSIGNYSWWKYIRHFIIKSNIE